MNIYIGHLSSDITPEDLQKAFGEFGYVSFVQIVKDRVAEDSTRFGFVEMPNKAEACNAIRRITHIKGERISVKKADPNINYASSVG